MLVQKFGNIFLLFLAVNFFIMIESQAPIDSDEKKPKPRLCKSRQCKNTVRDMNMWFNNGTKPCEDFYKFVCGGYEFRSTELISKFIERRNKINGEMLEFLQTKKAEYRFKTLGIARNIYNLCMKIDDTLDKMEMLSRIMDAQLHLGRPLTRTRKEQCLEIVKSKFDLLFCYLYAKKGKYEKATSLATEISDYVAKSFETMINQSMWMDEETKMEALNKLASIEYSIGLPHNIYEMGELLREQYNEIYSTTEDLFKWKTEPFKILNHLQYDVRRYEMKQMTKYQKDPSKGLNKHVLIRHINETERYYNEINTLSLGLEGLGFPILTRSLKSIDFGRVGFILGRAVAKLLVPSKNSENECWSENSLEEYYEKVECFKQPENRFNITKENSPEKTINEDLLDHVGFHAALLAYRIYASERENDTFLFLFDHATQEQHFIVGFVNLFCEHPLSHAYTAGKKNRRRSPAAARVNNVLRNSKYFAKIWNCPVGSNMNPANKCDFW